MASEIPSNTPQYIPIRAPKDTYRTVVLLFDGTGDKVDADVTNVVLFRNALRGWNDDTATDKQIVYYQQGIGTYQPQVRGRELAIPLLGSASQTIDKAIAWSLPAHVTHAYRWLAENYKPGDRISLFGFSRGAYIARVLAGMLNAVALLPADKLSKADKAYDLFDDPLPKARKRDDPMVKQALDKRLEEFAAFRKENNCTTVYIDFLGCWDTVNSVGIVRPIKLKYTAHNEYVRVFRHALALDEHRVRFKPNFWGEPQPKDHTNDGDSEHPGVDTDVQEVWFAGSHCDVGGGSVPNDVRPNLAHIPLRWMIREVFKKNTSILFRSSSLKIYGLNPDHLYPKVLPRPHALDPPQEATIPPPTKPPGFLQMLYEMLPFTSTSTPGERKTLAIPDPNITEEEHDLRDCLAPIYDQLELCPITWKLMEFYPMIAEIYQKNVVYPELLFKEARVANKSAGRIMPTGKAIHGDKIRVHRTVKTRMQAIMHAEKEKEKENYVPKGRVGYDDEREFNIAHFEEFEWVD